MLKFLMLANSEFGRNLAKQFAQYILPILMVVGVLWALWVGVAFGIAKDEQGRQNAKKCLVSVLRARWWINARKKVFYGIQ